MESMLQFLRGCLQHADLDTITKADMKKFYLKENGLKKLSAEEKKLFSEAINTVLEELSSKIQEPCDENQLNIKKVSEEGHSKENDKNVEEDEVISEEEAPEEEYIVEKIVDKKRIKGKVHYFLKWVGFPDSENTWEPKGNLDCPEIIAAFEASWKNKSVEQVKEKDSQELDKVLETDVNDIHMNSSEEDENRENTTSGVPNTSIKEVLSYSSNEGTQGLKTKAVPEDVSKGSEDVNYSEDNSTLFPRKSGKMKKRPRLSSSSESNSSQDEGHSSKTTNPERKKRKTVNDSIEKESRKDASEIKENLSSDGNDWTLKFSSDSDEENIALQEHFKDFGSDENAFNNINQTFTEKQILKDNLSQNISPIDITELNVDTPKNSAVKTFNKENVPENSPTKELFVNSSMVRDLKASADNLHNSFQALSNSGNKPVADLPLKQAVLLKTPSSKQQDSTKKKGLFSLNELAASSKTTSKLSRNSINKSLNQSLCDSNSSEDEPLANLAKTELNAIKIPKNKASKKYLSDSNCSEDEPLANLSKAEIKAPKKSKNKSLDRSLCESKSSEDKLLTNIAKTELKAKKKSQNKALKKSLSDSNSSEDEPLAKLSKAEIKAPKKSKNKSFDRSLCESKSSEDELLANIAKTELKAMKKSQNKALKKSLSDSNSSEDEPLANLTRSELKAPKISKNKLLNKSSSDSNSSEDEPLANLSKSVLKAQKPSKNKLLEKNSFDSNSSENELLANLSKNEVKTQKKPKTKLLKNGFIKTNILEIEPLVNLKLKGKKHEFDVNFNKKSITKKPRTNALVKGLKLVDKKFKKRKELVKNIGATTVALTKKLKSIESDGSEDKPLNVLKNKVDEFPRSKTGSRSKAKIIDSSDSEEDEIVIEKPKRTKKSTAPNKSRARKKISDSEEEPLESPKKAASDANRSESENEAVSIKNPSLSNPVKAKTVSDSEEQLASLKPSSNCSENDSEDDSLANMSENKTTRHSSGSENEVIPKPSKAKKSTSLNKLSRKGNISDSEDDNLADVKQASLNHAKDSENESEDEPLINIPKGKKVMDSSASEDEIVGKTKKKKQCSSKPVTKSRKSNISDSEDENLADVKQASSNHAKDSENESEDEPLINIPKGKKVMDSSASEDEIVGKTMKKKQCSSKPVTKSRKTNISDSEDESLINLKPNSSNIVNDSVDESLINISIGKKIDLKNQMVRKTIKSAKGSAKRNVISDSEDELLENIQQKSLSSENSSEEDEALAKISKGTLNTYDNTKSKENSSSESDEESKKNASDSEEELLINLKKKSAEGKKTLKGKSKNKPTPNKESEESSDSDAGPLAEKIDNSGKSKVTKKISSSNKSLSESSSADENAERTQGSKNNSKPSKEEKRSKTVKEKKRPSASENKIENLKKYVRAAGIRVKSYDQLFEKCKSMKAKCEKLTELLENHGMKGRPTLEKCKKLKKKLETKKEIAELDLSNILKTEGRRSKRSACVDTTNYKEVEKAPTPVKKFSRLQGIIDSEGSD
ncbi:hypothetical protein JTE90_005285 [Oedothorax gibbosus]|uniref:Chromo domain-containing protein n=1 Tax=Oedothorax gibbosus TaxID=931172 RepID=A0AAV6U343_9ARAC|nr:hypothetical protein JTE90_005285 [Oedothorax gibbosus]